MVEGGISEQFKWFIPDTDMQRNKRGRRGGEKGGRVLLFSTDTKQFVPYSFE